MRHFLPSLSLVCLSAIVLCSSPAWAVSGAELIRAEPFRYGRFEARLQFAPGDGIISSFFLWKNGSEMPTVFWNEIDVEKVGEACMSYSSNALYGLPESSHTLTIPSTSDLCAGYHTHVIEWTPDHLSWLLDGTEVRRLTGADLQAFEDNALPGMQMRFNLWVGNASFGGNFSAATLPVYQYINWVSYSEYTPGMGEEGTDFTLLVRDDFDAALAPAWSFATWASPFNLSIHSPSNVTVVDGKVVLSLTADDALGFSGTPPADPADSGETTSPPALPSGGSTGAPSNAVPGGRSPSSGGCLVAASPPVAPWSGAPAWLLPVAAGVWLGRRRRELRQRKHALLDRD